MQKRRRYYTEHVRGARNPIENLILIEKRYRSTYREINKRYDLFFFFFAV